MKKLYQEPKLSILLLSCEDVITASSTYVEDSIDDLNVVDIGDLA